jgi:FtsH-binding integral membrane protein
MRYLLMGLSLAVTVVFSALADHNFMSGDALLAVAFFIAAIFCFATFVGFCLGIIIDEITRVRR